jgi:hypothetical protein
MKGLIVIIILVIAGFFIYQQISQPPDPLEVREKAQQTEKGMVQYLLNSMSLKRDADALAVSDDNATGQVKSAMRALEEEEKQLHTQCDDYVFFTMGAAGSYKAIFSSKDSGVLLKVTLIVKEKNGKYFVTHISQD